MAKALMIQGTGSGAGKSLLAAALCRIFSDRGMRVAPFKAQNMALNSSITVEGGEIGRAQALQARAARTESSVDMNPVLLKVAGESGCQVILQGRVHATMKAREYYAFRDEAWKFVSQSYKRISDRHDLIIIEGAGSPAEINLADVDIVNMAMAKHAKAPVILVGDIDKGGVFASLYGTVKLLGRDSRHIRGFVINKFRGDPAILAPGLDMIRERTGKPVIGVLPFLPELGLPEEDGLALTQKTGAGRQKTEEKTVKIVVVRLKYISNFTDFDPLAIEPDVELLYSENPRDFESADLVIIPGSKNTVKDLRALQENGLAASIVRAASKGTPVIGMCGGYQMMGRKICDPLCIESPWKEVDGLDLLDIETTFDSVKTTCRVEAEMIADFGFRIADFSGKDIDILKGYEIHMGRSMGDIGLFRARRISAGQSAIHNSQSEIVTDGSRKGSCWGTYLHGIFDNDAFRRGVINQVRKHKGLSPLDPAVSYSGAMEDALDRLAASFRKHVDMHFIEELL